MVEGSSWKGSRYKKMLKRHVYAGERPPADQPVSKPNRNGFNKRWR